MLRLIFLRHDTLIADIDEFFIRHAVIALLSIIDY